MTELFGYTFFQNAIIGIVIISISAAIIGSYIVTRRLVAISGGVTHACFGGLGLGYYLGLNPILMASIFAVASSVGVEWMASRYKVREDSAIAVVWSLGMAIGVLFIFLTPGYVPELNSFLFGNILTITVSDLWAFGVYTIVLIVFFCAVLSQNNCVCIRSRFCSSDAPSGKIYLLFNDSVDCSVYCVDNKIGWADAVDVNAFIASNDIRNLLS